MKHTRWLVALLVVLIPLVAAPPVTADETEKEAAPAPSGGEDETVEFVLEESMSLTDLLMAVRDTMDIPLIWDPRSRALQGKEVVGKLRFRGDKEQVLEAIGSVLAFYELVVIPISKEENRKYLVIDARQTAAILKLKPVYVELDDDNLADWEDRDGVFLTTTIRVENMTNLRDARNALNRIVTGQNIGNVTEVPAAKAFVVTDFAPNVVAIYRLLKRMDLPAEATGEGAREHELTFRAIRLKHASAADVAETLTAHFGANAPPAGGGPGRAPQQQQVAEVPPQPDLRIHADPRLNQVLITGMRKTVDRVAEALDAMDQAAPKPKPVIHLIRLQHIRAIDAAAALHALLRGAPDAWAEDGAGLRPSIEAHQETNAILIQAGEAAATTLRRVIADMDRAPEGEVAEEG